MSQILDEIVALKYIHLNMYILIQTVINISIDQKVNSHEREVKERREEKREVNFQFLYHGKEEYVEERES